MNRIIGTVLSRFAQLAPGGSSVRPRLQRWRGVRIGSHAWIGLFVYIDELHPEALSIGDNCSIGIRTSIITHFYWGPRRAANDSKVVVENNVFIGPHCVILPNVRIGEGAVIQAGSVVSQNVPAHTLWGTSSAHPLARATIPLTAGTDYADFLRGLQPMAPVPHTDQDRARVTANAESAPPPVPLAVQRPTGAVRRQDPLRQL